jgi:hypothetical protein
MPQRGSASEKPTWNPAFHDTVFAVRAVSPIIATND